MTEFGQLQQHFFTADAPDLVLLYLNQKKSRQTHSQDNELGYIS